MGILRITGCFVLGGLLIGCASDFNRAAVVGPNAPRDAWITLDSRSFQSVRYDSIPKRLQLVFHSGTLHSYDNFPESEFNRFMVLGGKWGFYKTNIRGIYPVVATYPPKKPGSYATSYRARLSDPGRIHYNEVKPERRDE